MKKAKTILLSHQLVWNPCLKKVAFYEPRDLAIPEKWLIRAVTASLFRPFFFKQEVVFHRVSAEIIAFLQKQKKGIVVTSQ